MSNQLRFRPKNGLDGNSLTITNVAAAVNQTDAVNLAGLTAAISGVTAGNVTSATNATNSTNTLVTLSTTNASYPIALAASSVTGEQSLLMDSAVTVNPSTGLVATTGNFMHVGGTSNSYFLAQDGTGRQHWYWNSAGGVTPTLVVGNEDANDLMHTAGNGATGTCTATIAGTVMTVTGTPSAPIVTYDFVTGGTINAGAGIYIVPGGSGTGGAGTYNLSAAATISTVTTFTLTPPSAICTASISGQTMTVSATIGGTLGIGQFVVGTNVTPGTMIQGGSGTSWIVNISQTTSSTTMVTGAGGLLNFRTATGINQASGASIAWQNILSLQSTGSTLISPLTLAGNLTMSAILGDTNTGRILLNSGSALKPSLAWSSDGLQDTGFFWNADGYTNMTNNGAYSGQFGPGGALTMVGTINGSNLSGTNTGDETAATIKTKLGITTLSGSNTGDQTLAGLGGAASGLATASGLTTAAAKVLVGGLSAGGALSEITLGTNLSITGSVLNAVGGTAPTTPNNFYNMTNTLAFAVTNALTSCGLTVAAGQRAIVRSIRVCNISSVADAITAQINVASPVVNTPIANAIPVPIGGAVELLVAPKVMSPGDLLEFQSLSASAGLQVIVSYEINTDTAYVNAGYITTTSYAVAFTSAGTNATIIESILIANSQTINCAFNVGWYNGSGVLQAYLVCNYVAPANASIEIIQNPFRLPAGHTIQAVCDGGASGIYISGRNV